MLGAIYCSITILMNIDFSFYVNDYLLCLTYSNLNCSNNLSLYTNNL